jgi:thiol-disulfide isomerase/thioredoxin
MRPLMARPDRRMTRMCKFLFAMVVCAMAPFPFTACPARADAAPKLAIRDLRHLPVVTMKPYDESADADAAVAAAFAEAKKGRKLVLIDLGGNWCPDCIVLANVMRLPRMQHFLRAHYAVAMVDVGRFDKNLQIPARFGIVKRLQGVPSLLIATPDGKLVNAGHVSALADARSMTPQGIADWLASWTK